MMHGVLEAQHWAVHSQVMLTPDHIINVPINRLYLHLRNWHEIDILSLHIQLVSSLKLFSSDTIVYCNMLNNVQFDN